MPNLPMQEKAPAMPPEAPAPMPEKEVPPMAEEVSDENMIYLPEGLMKGAKEGDPVEVGLEGVIANKDGKMYVKVLKLDGQPVAAVEEVEEKPMPPMSATKKDEMDIESGLAAAEAPPKK